LVEHTTENRGVAGSIPALAILRTRFRIEPATSLGSARIRSIPALAILRTRFRIEPATSLGSARIRSIPALAILRTRFRIEPATSLGSARIRSIPALATRGRLRSIACLRPRASISRGWRSSTRSARCCSSAPAGTPNTLRSTSSRAGVRDHWARGWTGPSAPGLRSHRQNRTGLRLGVTASAAGRLTSVGLWV
jgi:hypothetical protein